MTDNILPFPAIRRGPGADRAAAEASLAAAYQALDHLRETQRLGALAAEAIDGGDIDRMIAIRDQIIGHMAAGPRAAAPPAREVAAKPACKGT